MAQPLKAGVAAAAVALGVGAFTLNRYLVGVFYDDGLYAGLAVALARGAGYVHLHLPGAPAAVHYPPLYPLILAPLYGLLPVAAAGLAAKVLNLLLGALTAGLIAWHAERTQLLRGAPWWVTALVVAAAAIAVPVLTVQSVLFSEPLWGVLFAAAVITTDRPPAWRPDVAYAAAGGLAALALLTRSISVAAGLGLPLFLLFTRRVPWRQVAALALPVALAALGWWVWVATHRAGIDPALAFNYGSYKEPFRQAGLGFLPATLMDLPRPLGALTLAWLPPALRILFGLAAALLLLYGLWLFVRRSAVGFTLICYFGIVVVWPYVMDRFVWAVLPWLALAFAAGAWEVARWRRLQFAVALVAAAVAFGYARYETRALAGRYWETAARGVSENFRELLPGIDSLPQEAVVATDDEPLVWLYTGRRAVPLAITALHGREQAVPEPAEQRAYLERFHVTHVLLGSPSGDAARQLRPLIGAYPGWLVAVRAWPGGRWLFEVKRGR